MSVGDEHWIETTLLWLNEPEVGQMSEAVREGLERASSGELEALVNVLVAQPHLLGSHAQRLRILMQLVVARTVGLGEQLGDNAIATPPDALGRLYQEIADRDTNAAAHVLQLLALQADSEAIATLAELLTQSPPEDWRAVGLGLSPLWNASSELLEEFFEHLSDGFVHPATMAVLLDLANYAVRAGRLDSHPYQDRSESLTSLLSSVTAQLSQLEKDPSKFGGSVEEVQRTLGDSIALAVCLCDSLGLIGNDLARSSLSSTLALSHRRIQTEAAGALARLGDEEGRAKLVELAADRVARNRAVNYADELGFVDEIPAEFKVPQALAESELASWLAGSDQFGFPPSQMELTDARTQHWPGYEDPQDCYLFRYTYALPAGLVSNIGIAGPCSHAFHADLANLPVDDIYAAFAGWQAEHEEIFEVPMQQLNVAQRRETDRMQLYLEDQGLEVTRSIALTFFFGEVALIAEVTQEGKQLVAITDGQELLCYPMTNLSTSLSPDVVLCIFRGRKLLRTFNI